MQHERYNDQRYGLPSLSGQNSCHGKQDQRACQVAWVQVLVHDIQRCAGHWESKQSHEHGQARPSSGGLLKEPANNAPASPDDQQDRESMQQQFCPSHLHSGDFNKPRHPCIKDTCPQLQLEESRVVGVECRVQICLDGSQIDAIVFRTRMVPRDKEANRRKQQNWEASLCKTTTPQTEFSRVTMGCGCPFDGKCPGGQSECSAGLPAGCSADVPVRARRSWISHRTCCKRHGFVLRANDRAWVGRPTLQPAGRPALQGKMSPGILCPRSPETRILMVSMPSELIDATYMPDAGAAALAPPLEGTPDLADLKLALAIPTLHESENIRRVLDRVRSVLDLVGVRYEILVVDDDSRDGTAEIVTAVTQEDPRVRLLVRKGQRGLSGAILYGWQHTDAGILGVMDADLQHPPELLPQLLSAIHNGSDIAIGSRYISGGGVGGDRKS